MSAVLGVMIFIPLVLSIILHEIAHAYAAYLLGDDTAKKKGRLSLNPLHHVDLLGTIIIPLFLWIGQAGFMFGWARPVPVNLAKIKKKPGGQIIVASAGILMNLWLAIISALLLMLAAFISAPQVRGGISVFLIYMIIFNVGLAIFNAIPIPPMDGSQILLGWVKKPWARKYLSSYRYGFVIMVFLLFILPSIGNAIGIDLNFFREALITITRYLCSFLM